MPGHLSVSNVGTPNANPLNTLTAQAVLDVVRNGVTFVDDATPVNDTAILTQTTPPTSTFSDRLWRRVSTDVSPITMGLYFYWSGRWVQVVSHKVGMVIELVATFNPAAYFDTGTGRGLFDAGTAGVAGDFYGWELLHLDATYKDRFSLMANSYDTGTGRWMAKDIDAVNRSSGNGGGALIAPGMLPDFPIKTGNYSATASPATIPRILSSTLFDTAVELGMSDNANTSGYILPGASQAYFIPPLPAYVAMVKMAWIGYTY